MLVSLTKTHFVCIKKLMSIYNEKVKSGNWEVDQSQVPGPQALVFPRDQVTKVRTISDDSKRNHSTRNK